jgi:hypothetical protein
VGWEPGHTHQGVSRQGHQLLHHRWGDGYEEEVGLSRYSYQVVVKWFGGKREVMIHQNFFQLFTVEFKI